MKNNAIIAPQYTSDTIESYEGLNAIRMRPTIFIQSLGVNGVKRIFNEIVGNSIDEFNAMRGDYIKVNINNNTHIVVVEDFASGIPIEKFEDIVTKMFTGGKFNNSSYAGIGVLGLNGIGIKACNSVSDYFIIDTWRDGKHAHLESAKGVTKRFKITKEETTKHGTRVEYRPDITIFGDINMPKDIYTSMLEMISYISSGLKIDFIYNGGLIQYFHPEGM
jgi:DNA gyrase/topoisomerase IV subunit B